MDFVRSHLGKCTSDQLNTSSSVLIWKKMEEKVFNWSKGNLTQVTFYKIHILGNRNFGRNFIREAYSS